MRYAIRLARVAGALAVLVCLALSAPGVRIASADAPEAGSESLERFLQSLAAGSRARPVGENPAVCRAGSPESRVMAGDQRLRWLHQRMAARAAADAERRGVARTGQVVLNGRGYNYGAGAPAIDPAVLQRELRAPR